MRVRVSDEEMGSFEEGVGVDRGREEGAFEMGVSESIERECRRA